MEITMAKPELKSKLYKALRMKVKPSNLTGYAVTDRYVGDKASVQSRYVKTSNCKLYETDYGMFLIHNNHKDKPYRVIGIYPTEGKAQRRRVRHVKHLENNMGKTIVPQSQLGG